MKTGFWVPVLLFLAIGSITLYLKDSNQSQARVTTSHSIDLSKESPQYQKVFKILETSCNHCHSSYAGYSEASWVITGQVIPGNPQRSYLYYHLRGSETGGAESMPPKKALSKEELRVLAEWIRGLSKGLAKMPASFSLPKTLAKKINPALTLTEEEVYFRCHSQFSRSAPDSDDQLLAKVKKGLLSSVDACLQLLKNATFNSKSDSISNSIRRTFHGLHNSWFNNFLLFNLQASFPSYDILDITGPALYFTKSLFSSDFNFKQILSGNQNLRAVRSQEVANDYFIYKKESSEMRLSQHGFFVGKEKSKSRKNWNPNFVARGNLLDIKALKADSKDLLPLYLDQTDSYLAKIFKGPLNIRQNLGGGLIGSQSFLLFNHGRELGETMDGGLLLPRRWSKMVFSNLLCRELPLLRKVDVIKDIQKKSDISFRKQASCLQCHSSIDPLAAAARQMTAVASSDHPDGYTQHIRLHSSNPKLGNGKLLVDSDTSYHLRPPHGRLRYRNLYGKLVESSFQNMQELGQRLLEQDDLYICTAKRYLYFLTGIDVAVEDYSTQLKSYDPISLEYIRFLIFLGKRLKQHQNLSYLIKDIVSSDLYRQRDYQIYASD
ncbi:MAG: hypothetical protein HOM21_14375 [Halobacteriovoraceae bacterium]|nr:hypothetical protein [Halobacteriovoraceae bacterium]